MPDRQQQPSQGRLGLGNSNNGLEILGGINIGNRGKSPRSDKSSRGRVLSGKSENSPGDNVGLSPEESNLLDCDLDTSGFGLGMGEARAKLILGKIESLKKDKGTLEEVINRQVRVDSSELGDWLVLQFLENRKYFELEKKQFADDCEATLLELEQRESSLSQDEATLKAHLDDATKRDAELTEKIERVTDVKNFQRICADFDANLNQNIFLTHENSRFRAQHLTSLSALRTSQSLLLSLRGSFSSFRAYHTSTLSSLSTLLPTLLTSLSTAYEAHLQVHLSTHLVSTHNLKAANEQLLSDSQQLLSELKESLEVNKTVSNVLNELEID